MIINGSPNLGQKTRPNNNQQKKENMQNSRLCYPGIKLKECKKKDKFLELARELKKTMEHEGHDCANCDWWFWHSN